MFSQWRHAVESLAQPVKPAGSAEGGSAEEAPARPSVDGVRASLSSSTLLAESALNNLRKTLVAQRPASPANATAQVSTSPPEPAATPPPKPRPSTRTTLEDRLRAKFAIGDASNATTPASSSRASPAPVSVADHPLAGPPSRSSTPDLPTVKGPPNPLSPRSTPLPDSPLVSPAPQPFQSLIAHAANISVTSLPAPLELPSSEAGPVTSDPVEESVEKDATQAPEKTAIATHSADSTQDEKSTDAEPQVEDTSSVAALGPRTESPGPTAAPADISEAPASENPPGSSEGGATEALPAQTSPEPSQTTVAPPAETSVVPEDIPSPPSDIPDSVPPAEVSVPPSDAPAPPSDTPLPASNGPHETLSPETPTQAEHERPEVVVEVSPTVNQTAEPDRSVPGEEIRLFHDGL
ncbi:hypothetical protein C2E23DRAFT_519131 [Lenzites betulinus]|nr:hypothetical protein C2E23DRAFT_519131 [Lenzites betulinus]